jgi:sensor histidine kinase YesM
MYGSYTSQFTQNKIFWKVKQTSVSAVWDGRDQHDAHVSESANNRFLANMGLIVVFYYYYLLFYLIIFWFFMHPVSEWLSKYLRIFSYLYCFVMWLMCNTSIRNITFSLIFCLHRLKFAAFEYYLISETETVWDWRKRVFLSLLEKFNRRNSVFLCLWLKTRT